MAVDWSAPVPWTAIEAIDRIVAELSESERALFRREGSAGMHFSLGAQIRNAWGLWRGARGDVLRAHFAETYQLGHADDMSALILYGVACRLTGGPADLSFFLAHEAKRFRDHWIGNNRDPISCLKINDNNADPVLVDIPAV